MLAPWPRPGDLLRWQTMRLLRAAPFGLFLLSGCSVWVFSGESWIDRTRPAVLVETTGGVELGAATEFGVPSRRASSSVSAEPFKIREQHRCHV